MRKNLRKLAKKSNESVRRRNAVNERRTLPKKLTILSLSPFGSQGMPNLQSSKFTLQLKELNPHFFVISRCNMALMGTPIKKQ
jgi:hypothetical protein